MSGDRVVELQLPTMPEHALTRCGADSLDGTHGVTYLDIGAKFLTPEGLAELLVTVEELRDLVPARAALRAGALMLRGTLAALSALRMVAPVLRRTTLERDDVHIRCLPSGENTGSTSAPG